MIHLDKNKKLNKSIQIMPGQRKNTLAERLKMLQMDESDEAFAARCGLPVSTLRNYLAESRYPTTRNLEIISKNLGVSIDWLVDGKLADVEDMTDDEIVALCELDPQVIELDTTEGWPIPVVKAYDDERHHLRYYCIHCRCWHFHGRGGKEQPYTEGRAGDWQAHCIAVNSPFHKYGVILNVVGKFRDIKRKIRQEGPLQCTYCGKYYSAACNACGCGMENIGRKSEYPIIEKLYKKISITGLHKNIDKNVGAIAIAEEELQMVRNYRPIAKMDADTLGEIQTWLNDMEQWRPGFKTWFRHEFQNRFPEFDEWKERTLKKSTGTGD